MSIVNKNGEFEGKAIIYGIIYKHSFQYIGLCFSKEGKDRNIYQVCRKECELLGNKEMLNLLDNYRNKLDYVILNEFVGDEDYIYEVQKTYFNEASRGFLNQQKVESYEKGMVLRFGIYGMNEEKNEKILFWADEVENNINYFV